MTADALARSIAAADGEAAAEEHATRMRKRRGSIAAMHRSLKGGGGGTESRRRSATIKLDDAGAAALTAELQQNMDQLIARTYDAAGAEELA